MHQGVQSSRYLVSGLPQALVEVLRNFLRSQHPYCTVCRHGGIDDETRGFSHD